MSGPGRRPGGSFTRAFLREMSVRIGLAVVAMLLAVGGSRLLRDTGEWGAFGGAVLGLAIGLALMALVLRRRR